VGPGAQPFSLSAWQYGHSAAYLPTLPVDAPGERSSPVNAAPWYPYLHGLNGGPQGPGCDGADRRSVLDNGPSQRVDQPQGARPSPVGRLRRLPRLREGRPEVQSQDGDTARVVVEFGEPDDAGNLAQVWEMLRDDGE
jgi:hypothetical protein